MNDEWMIWWIIKVNMLMFIHDYMFLSFFLIKKYIELIVEYICIDDDADNYILFELLIIF